jgi:peptide/nickel transport system permease protein
MLAEGRDVLRVAWWPSVFPGVAITLTVIAFTVVGSYLQRRFEGRLAP